MAPTVQHVVDGVGGSNGYWGTPTATIDWCERNYEISPYMAEFWNTVSNLTMIVPPAYGALVVWKQSLGLRFAMCHLLLLVIGLGSWSFHMTLLYGMQLFDELPMLWGSCVLVYCLIGLLFPEVGRRKFVVVGLFSYAFLVTVVYLTIKKPIFHEVAYGILVALIFLMNIHLARTRKCEIRLFIACATMYLLGFMLWNIDNVFCSHLSSVRTGLPPVAVPLTQLHAWWHLLAGYASYMHIVFCTHASAINSKLKIKITTNAFAGLSLETKQVSSFGFNSHQLNVNNNNNDNDHHDHQS